MLMALSASHKRPKAPMRQNGMVVITMIENLGDSNWAAMTTNTRKIARGNGLEQSRKLLCHGFIHLVLGNGYICIITYSRLHHLA